MPIANEPGSLDITSISADDLLQVLANFSREACSSMDSGDGARAGLYVRRINDVLKLRRIQPIELDDVDLAGGLVYRAAHS